MKPPYSNLLAAVALVMPPLMASAQQEQWLEYRSSNQPKAYRWVDLSTNAPPGVALPAGLNPGAWFGRWTNGLDASGARVLCLAPTRRGGLCDQLYFDINGDGRLDNESPIRATQRDSTMSYFDPVKAVFKGEDGPVSYHVITRFYLFERTRAQLLIGSAGWYEGTVTIAGKPRRIQLIDNTVNAVFNDIAEAPYDSDRVTLLSGTPQDLYLGRYLEVDGQLAEISIARDGAFIKARPAEVSVGSVKVPPSLTEFTAYGPNGQFVRRPEKGTFTLPAGKYRAHGWTVERREQGTTWKLTGSQFGAAAAFEVASNQPVSLDVGEPVRAVLTFRESLVGGSFDLKLAGALGETVDIMRGDSRVSAPQLHFASVNGSFRATNTFEYG
jgi:hypothetical protein